MYIHINIDVIDIHDTNATANVRLPKYRHEDS